MHAAAAVDEDYGLAAAAGEGDRDYSVVMEGLESGAGRVGSEFGRSLSATPKTVQFS